LEERVDVDCPYCGETIPVYVDRSGGDQAYVEDCWVCCRPIELRIHVDGDDIRVDAAEA
jgi:hypothetical protein